MKAKRFFGSVIVTLFLAALALPSHTLADDDDRELLLEQLTQFNGGCPPNPVEEVGGCIDVQFAIHRSDSVCNGNPSESIGDVSITEVRKISDESLAGGSSTLVRSEDGVSYSLSTGELAPDAPYTNWWVAFNPDNECLATCDCDGSDLRGDRDSVFWATGAVTDILGHATFSANVDFGSLPDGEDQVPFSPDFANPIEPGAEIHIVVRAHGPKLDDDDDDE